MRSLYGRIFVAFFTTLVVSLFSFVTVFFVVTRPRMSRNFRGLVAVQAETAARAFSTGGRESLRTYVDALDAGLEGQHYLVDDRGMDVLSGEDRSALLSPAQAGSGPPRTPDGKRLVIESSSDGRFKLIATLAGPTLNLSVVLPYFALLFGAIAGVCWLITAGIASPVRRLAAVVERFGAGDMAARIHLQRRDELGDLATAYNKMADRIGVLLGAERQLLQDISHELRSPLARLNVGIELSRSAEDRSASADRLQLEAHRLTALVTSLIETTRAEGNLAAPEM
jgi:signal transduction histidine kinase